MFISPVAYVFIICYLFIQGFPGGASGKEPTFQYRRHQRQGNRSLDWKDPLQQGMTTHSVFLPGKSHGQRSLVGYSPVGREESGMTEETACTHIALIYSDLKSYCGEGNGNPLQ